MTDPVNPDQLRITIEMGDDYQPSSRLRAALEELAAAFAETDVPEVEGFRLDNFGIQELLERYYQPESLSPGQRQSTFEVQGGVKVLTLRS